MKSSGDSTLPCLTPLPTLNILLDPLTTLIDFADPYISLSASHMFSLGSKKHTALASCYLNSRYVLTTDISTIVLFPARNPH